MQILKEIKIDKEINDGHDEEFKIITAGLYLIEVIAGAKSWWQNFKSWRSFFNDDDLTVILDGRDIFLVKAKKKPFGMGMN